MFQEIQLSLYAPKLSIYQFLVCECIGSDKLYQENPAVFNQLFSLLHFVLLVV